MTHDSTCDGRVSGGQRLGVEAGVAGGLPEGAAGVMERLWVLIMVVTMNSCVSTIYPHTQSPLDTRKATPPPKCTLLPSISTSLPRTRPAGSQHPVVTPISVFGHAHLSAQTALPAFLLTYLPSLTHGPLAAQVWAPWHLL